MVSRGVCVGGVYEVLYWVCGDDGFFLEECLNVLVYLFIGYLPFCVFSIKPDGAVVMGDDFQGGLAVGYCESFHL